MESNERQIADEPEQIIGVATTWEQPDLLDARLQKTCIWFFEAYRTSTVGAGIQGCGAFAVVDNGVGHISDCGDRYEPESS